MTVGLQVCFDSSGPARLGAFWAELLGYVEQPPPEGFALLAGGVDGVGVPEDERESAYAIVDPAGAGPRLFFQRVPEPRRPRTACTSTSTSAPGCRRRTDGARPRGGRAGGGPGGHAVCGR